ncbi:TPA: tRNA 2-thiouridine(34) synthase MnmA [Candidatus Taylorbacteria bacterium]|nr:tRNA 2-thiouridine(34) synthase MnmA [Candidatus Taylorbacteria bacterium]
MDEAVELKKKKVFVGLSGGVDSSVSAALLKRDGYDVTGVFIKAWYPDFLTCTWKDDRRDAMRVCATLDIPFLTVDLEKEYKKEVIDYMIREYAEGRTPNPDVMCNKVIKFGGFFKKALEMGADYVATGHYARVVESHSEVDEPIFKMLEAKDDNKDQTYFLWTLTQNELARTLFPIGDLPKPEVRELAAQFGLPTASKKDSQGLCFLGKIDLKDFLGHYFKEQQGDVIDDETGEVVGTHTGAWFFTIGERRGFTTFAETPDEKPYYIVAKDVKENTLTVSHKESAGAPLMPTREIRITNVNWITGIAPLRKKISARMRYRQELVSCKVSQDADGYFVEFDKDQSIVSAGQSIVFYAGGECLGGAVVE